MSLEINGAGIGSAAWKLLNTGLGAAGTAMGATALGSKTSEEKVRQIIREENGCGHHGYCGNGWGRGFNETVFVQPCSDNTPVNRFELGQNLEIARLQAKEYSDMSFLKIIPPGWPRKKNVSTVVWRRFSKSWLTVVNVSRPKSAVWIKKLPSTSRLQTSSLLLQTKSLQALTAV